MSVIKVSKEGKFVSIFRIVRSSFRHILTWLSDGMETLYSVCSLAIPTKWPKKERGKNFFPFTVTGLYWNAKPFVPNAKTISMLGLRLYHIVSEISISTRLDGSIFRSQFECEMVSAHIFSDSPDSKIIVRAMVHSSCMRRSDTLLN